MTHQDRPEANPQVFEIVVDGDLGARWSKWLNGLAHTAEVQDSSPAGTILTVPVRDQAALRGLLNQLWDLNLTLISVRRIDPHPKQEGDR
ncbi:MAG TPA: hypothetical protein VLL77_10950 [Anaerolineales bacterium]|nr:hypothetical protein [Anaerolineales bacterium]